MQKTTNLAVSRNSRLLAVQVYRVCHQLPDYERFGLASQMRRAAVSVGSNIAEGCGREGDRALVHFLQIAMGSASELEFQLELCTDLEILSVEAITPPLREARAVKRMLAKLILSLRRALASAEGKRVDGAVRRMRPKGLTD